MVQFSQINVNKNYTNLIFIFHDHTFWESFILLWVFLWVFESQVFLFLFLKGYTFLVCSLYKVFGQYLDIPFFRYLFSILTISILPLQNSPKWLTLIFFQMHAWRHPGGAKICCMPYKIKHMYTTVSAH